MKLYAYSRTMAGAQRLARARQAPALTVEAPKLNGTPIWPLDPAQARALMVNLLAALMIFMGLCIVSDEICHSLDCNGGNKAACEIVAKRYEARR